MVEASKEELAAFDSLPREQHELRVKSQEFIMGSAARFTHAEDPDTLKKVLDSMHTMADVLFKDKGVILGTVKKLYERRLAELMKPKS